MICRLSSGSSGAGPTPEARTIGIKAHRHGPIAPAIRTVLLGLLVAATAATAAACGSASAADSTLEVTRTVQVTVPASVPTVPPLPVGPSAPAADSASADPAPSPSASAPSAPAGAADPSASVPPTDDSPSTAAATTVPATSATTLPTIAAPTSTLDAAAVQQAATAAADQGQDRGVTEHIAVIDRGTGALIASSSAHKAVPSMSIVKLFIATDVISQAGGVNQLDAHTQAQLWTMITRSDDAIAQDFYDQGGGDALVRRTIARYQLQDSAPTPQERYWGDVQISAADIASLLQQALSSPATGPWLTAAMQASADTGSDGFDQNFGMNAITGAGSKQGWGCCLGGVMAIHSAGFTANRIVVVLSTAAPDVDYHQLGTAGDLMADPGARTSVTAVTAAAAAVGA